MSRIESLPDSIGKLHELRVLDLRACHNLENLGEGITKLGKLEYLDLSECHLLVGMPKGLERLTQLRILKGFVVANTNSKDPCHLNELTKLDNLRKLGIVIGKLAVPTEDEFLKFSEFNALESMTIRWGVQRVHTTESENNKNEEKIASHLVTTMKLPTNLKKLDIHCFPLPNFPEWVPKGVRKLYIRGGKLATLGDEEDWEVEVLRLRFLSDLEYNHARLQHCFKKLKPGCTEIHQCPKFMAEQ
jgi:Leucine-rich repeat (LRR) protein